MSDNLRDFPPMEDDKAERLRNTRGNEPPSGGPMEARVSALEKGVLEIRERLVRVETKLDGIEKTMATKADLSDLRAAIAESFNSQTKWFIGTAVVLAGIAFTAAKFIH